MRVKCKNKGYAVSEEIILPESDKAANYGQVEGWISRGGRFFGNASGAEDLARYDGANHRRCPDCGAIINKLSMCQKCREKAEKERWEKLPLVAWDGETPMYEYSSCEEIFWDVDAVENYCLENECQPQDLMLVLAVKSTPPSLAESIGEQLLEVYPEGWELVDIPRPIKQAIYELDRAVNSHHPEIWEPGRKRVILQIAEVEVEE